MHTQTETNLPYSKCTKHALTVFVWELWVLLHDFKVIYTIHIWLVVTAEKSEMDKKEIAECQLNMHLVSHLYWNWTKLHRDRWQRGCKNGWYDYQPRNGHLNILFNTYLTRYANEFIVFMKCEKFSAVNQETRFFFFFFKSNDWTDKFNQNVIAVIHTSFSWIDTKMW